MLISHFAIVFTQIITHKHQKITIDRGTDFPKYSQHNEKQLTYWRSIFGPASWNFCSHI